MAENSSSADEASFDDQDRDLSDLVDAPEHPAFAGLPLGADDLTSEIAADAAARHALGEVLPIVGTPLAEPESDKAEADSAWAGVSDEIAEPPAEASVSTDEPHDLPGERLAGETLRLERKHPLAIRWMHWINFPVLFTMIWSGLLIYWNDSDNAYQHPHRVYRIGLGPFTLFRFFPDWFYTLIHAQYNVTQGLGWHFFFMWLFAINGILYALFLLWSKEWKFMVPDRRSIAEAIQVTLVDLHLRKGLPPQTKYNGAQKIAYTLVVLMGLGSLVTGLAIYKPTSAHWLTTLLGGYEMARWFHFWLTMGFCAFFLVHVGQVILAGWNNFRAMVSGYELRPLSEPSLEAERSRF